MVDLYLQAMMHGLVNVKQDSYEEAIENEIKLYVESLHLEEQQDSAPQLMSVRLKCAKMVEELKEEFRLKELCEFIESAFSYIKNEGLDFFNVEEFELFNSEFQGAIPRLQQFNPNDIENNFQNILEISDTTMDAIHRLATHAYTQEKYHSCLSLFVLLSTLNHTNADYWFRVGIAAQKDGNFELALKAYAITVYMDPESIGARLFSVECCLAGGNLEDAIAELHQAKKIIENLEVELIWLALLEVLTNEVEISSLK